MRRRGEDGELDPLPVRGQAAPAGRTDPGAARAAGPEPVRPGLDGSGRVVVLGVLLAGLVVGGALTGIDGDRRRVASDTPAALVAPGPAAMADEAAPDGWRRGTAGPLRHRDLAVRVWTGTEFVVWGGDPDSDAGAAYNPATDRWRAIAPAPIPGRCAGVAAWTGREMLVWGRACRLSPGPSPGRPHYATAGAAYDPAADRWRLLPAGPLPAGSPTLEVWTGSEWILGNPLGPAAALEPDTGRWRTLPPLPRPFTFVSGQWTGREVAVLGVEVLEKGPSTVGTSYRQWAAAFDPARNRWRPLPDPPLERTATIVWDGRRLVAWDQLLHAAVLDPAGGPWRPLPEVPVGETPCAPHGVRLDGAVFAEACGQGAVFHTGSDTWEKVPHPRSVVLPPVWTGQDLLFPASRVWLFRPPVAAAGPDGRHRAPVPMNRAAAASRGRAPGSPGGGPTAARG
jgi:hypothetical protein